MSLQQALQGNTPAQQIQPDRRKSSGSADSVSFKIILLAIGITLGVLGTLGIQQFISSRNNIDPEKVVASVQGLEISREIDEADDIVRLENVKALRDENDLQAEVYADAKNGDLAIIYDTDYLLIYRQSENKIVYDGLTPRALADQRQQELVELIKSLAVNQGIVASDTEDPELSIISDPARLRLDNPVFYSQSEIGDVLAYFDDEDKIVLYRPDTEAIYNSGKVSTLIE